MVVPMLAELFGLEELPQKEPLRDAPPLPDTSLPLLLLLGESDFGLLVEAALLLGILSPIATPTFAAVPLPSPLAPPPLLYHRRLSH